MLFIPVTTGAKLTKRLKTDLGIMPVIDSTDVLKKKKLVPSETGNLSGAVNHWFQEDNYQ